MIIRKGIHGPVVAEAGMDRLGQCFDVDPACKIPEQIADPGFQRRLREIKMGKMIHYVRRYVKKPEAGGGQITFPAFSWPALILNAGNARLALPTRRRSDIQMCQTWSRGIERFQFWEYIRSEPS